MARALVEETPATETEKTPRERRGHLSEPDDAVHDFIDGISHEFRAPLSVIREFVTILEDGLAGPVTIEQREYLGIMSDCVDDLMLMVKDLIDLGKLEAGLLTVHRAACAVKDLVEPIHDVLSRKAQSRRLTFSIALDDGLPTVWADAAQISRVLSNLVIHAIRSTSEGGSVELWAHADLMSGEVILGVTDNGPGIDPDQLRELCERFSHVGRQSARSRGVGLGLDIAKELVALNFGTMSVHSELGRGSTLAISVPTADPEGLLRRYLRHPEFARNRLRHVSLVEVGAERNCPDTAASAVNELLHHVLRSSDMVLRVGPRRWILVLDEGAARSQAVLDRVKTYHRQVNEDNPTSPLPGIALALLGTWQGKTQADEVLAAFQNACLAEETAAW